MPPRLKMFVVSARQLSLRLPRREAIEPSDAAPQQPTFVSGRSGARGRSCHARRRACRGRDARRGGISEDGVRETIQTFERITYARPGSAPTVAPRTLARSLEAVADPRSRALSCSSIVDTPATSWVTAPSGAPVCRRGFPYSRRSNGCSGRRPCRADDAESAQSICLSTMVFPGWPASKARGRLASSTPTRACSAIPKACCTTRATRRMRAATPLPRRSRHAISRR